MTRKVWIGLGCVGCLVIGSVLGWWGKSWADESARLNAEQKARKLAQLHSLKFEEFFGPFGYEYKSWRIATTYHWRSNSSSGSFELTITPAVDLHCVSEVVSAKLLRPIGCIDNVD